MNIKHDQDYQEQVLREARQAELEIAIEKQGEEDRKRRFAEISDFLDRVMNKRGRR